VNCRPTVYMTSCPHSNEHGEAKSVASHDPGDIPPDTMFSGCQSPATCP
jgi:hypothetical protein